MAGRSTHNRTPRTRLRGRRLYLTPATISITSPLYGIPCSIKCQHTITPEDRWLHTHSLKNGTMIIHYQQTDRHIKQLPALENKRAKQWRLFDQNSMEI